MMAFDYEMEVPEDVWPKRDRMGVAHGFDWRAPLLDDEVDAHRLSQLIRRTVGKWVSDTHRRRLVGRLAGVRVEAWPGEAVGGRVVHGNEDLARLHRLSALELFAVHDGQRPQRPAAQPVAGAPL